MAGQENEGSIQEEASEDWGEMLEEESEPIIIPFDENGLFPKISEISLEQNESLAERRRLEFLRERQRAAELFTAKYNHVIDGYRKLQQELLKIPKPECPVESVAKLSQVREIVKRVPPIEGVKPQTEQQLIGYMTAKPEFNLKIFGSENNHPMRSSMHLYGWHEESQY